MTYSVILIEDNKMNSRLTQKVLESAGYNVSQFNSAEAALDQIKTIQPHVILLDLQLPGISGYDFARQVRRFDQFKNIPLVAISANVREEDKNQAFDSGCDGFIDKPVNTRTLAEEIQSYIEAKS